MKNIRTLALTAEQIRAKGTQALINGDCLDGFDVLDNLQFNKNHRERFLTELSIIMNKGNASLGFRKFLLDLVKEQVEDVVLFID
jgi:hypothetical protein